MMTSKTIAAGLTFAAWASAAPACAGPQDRMSDAAAPRTAPAQQGRSTFYPDEVKGGVAGNLPFNNQVRKHTDGLNANGSGR